MNLFSLSVVVLFIAAGIMEAINKNMAKAVFYWLSAAININIIFMR